VTVESTGRKYNAKAYGKVLLVNSRARPDPELLSLSSRPETFAAVAGGTLVMARADATGLKPGVLGPSASSRISRSNERLTATPESTFEGYWDLVESNGLAIAEQAPRFADPAAMPSTVEVRGPATNLRVEPGADIEGHVTFDVRLGPVAVMKGASIESFSRVMGPAYIGTRTKVYSAQVGGGTSVFESCKVGGQVENSIIMPFTNKAHLGYVGDSYVGEWVNLGAGSNFSNLKNTYGNIRVRVGDKRLDTGMVKLGPAVGDLSKVSIGALVYAGRSVGAGSHVTGLAADDVPPFTYFEGTSARKVELKVDSVVETQRRMMERRGKVLSRAFEGLIRRAFSSTSEAREGAGVKKGKLS